MTETTDRDLYDDPDRDTDYEYDDPEELHRVRRIQQIHDARERFERARLAARGKAATNQVSDDALRKVTTQLALDYVRQLEPILARTGNDLLDRQVTLPARRVTCPDGSTATVEETTVTVRTLLDESGTITVTTEYQAYDSHSNCHQTRTHETPLPMDEAAATRLVRLCDDFLEGIMPSGIAETTDDEWEV
jgi:hypothetical protein